MIQATSILCLAALAALCLAGIFSHHYRDNWLQFAGLWGLVFWSTGRLIEVAGGGYVSPYQLLAHGSMAVYALGTAVKVAMHRRREPRDRPPPPTPLPDEALRRVAGGKGSS